jgi:hypothetical protein
MRKRRPFSARALAAMEAWMPMDGRQFAVLMLIVLGALTLGLFVH